MQQPLESDSTRRTVLKSSITIGGYSRGIDHEFPYVMKYIFQKLQKGECIDLTEDLYKEV